MTELLDLNIRNVHCPLAKKIKLLSQKLSANFHALPLSGHALEQDKVFSNFYHDFYGKNYLEREITLAGEFLDSFFFPKHVIKASQQLAASAFRAKDTLFVTCGTTIANYIAIEALLEKNERVLLDRNAHQSLHFAVSNKTNHIEYLHSHLCCEYTEKKVFHIDDLLDMVLKAREAGQPFVLIAISASSYDGIIYKLSDIVQRVIEISPEVTFLFDEAWSSAFYFSEQLFQYTAGYAAECFPKVNIVSTQSAHKSLLALRQGSYIHSFADEKITTRLYEARFRYHSTSPSYPILASLDLARAHMELRGSALMHSLKLMGERFRKALEQHPELFQFQVPNRLTHIAQQSGGIAFEDSLKISINIKAKIATPGELQKFLFQTAGIYLNRFTKNSLLINFHIGLTDQDIDKLLEALLKMNKHFKNKETYFPTKLSTPHKNRFIINYPPGIPLVVPGEDLSLEMFERIQEYQRVGISVFEIN